MLTDLGKLIRRWRILRRDVLFNMAKALDMQKSYYLSPLSHSSRTILNFIKIVTDTFAKQDINPPPTVMWAFLHMEKIWKI